MLKPWDSLLGRNKNLDLLEFTAAQPAEWIRNSAEPPAFKYRLAPLI